MYRSIKSKEWRQHDVQRSLTCNPGRRIIPCARFGSFAARLCYCKCFAPYVGNGCRCPAPDRARRAGCGAKPGTDDAVSGSCDPSGGSRPRREKRICHGRPDQRFAGGFSESLIGLAGRNICGVGSVAGSHWHLWSDCLLGEPVRSACAWRRVRSPGRFID